jgi:hypothetical protein
MTVDDPEAIVGLLRVIEMPERWRRLFACWCVRNTPLADGRKVWDLLTDERSRRAVEVAEMRAAGKTSREHLDVARVAACEAREELWRAAAAADATTVAAVAADAVAADVAAATAAAAVAAAAAAAAVAAADATADVRYSKDWNVAYSRARRAQAEHLLADRAFVRAACRHRLLESARG